MSLDYNLDSYEREEGLGDEPTEDEEDICDLQEDEEIFTSRSDNGSYFDLVIGNIEDVIMDDGFQSLQSQFLEKHWQSFEDSIENKHCYMEIFQEYNSTIEKFIENYLIKKIPDFNMEDFVAELEEKKNELDGEVFEVLFTFTDFVAFKEMFLDYRAVKLGNTVDLSGTLFVTSEPKPSNGYCI